MADMKGPKKDIIMVTLVIFLFIVIGITAISQTALYLVLIGLSSTFVYLIMFYTSLYNDRVDPFVFWISPILFPVLFLLLWSSKLTNLISGMDGPSLTAFNIIISYGLNVVCLFVFSVNEAMDNRRNEKVSKLKQGNVEKERYFQESTKQLSAYEKEIDSLRRAKEEFENEAKQYAHDYENEIDTLKQELEEAHSELSVSKNNFETSLRSIEDKCKAINFVIGRVYSNKRGGNDKIRGILNIDREWYNKFSEIATNFNAEYAAHLVSVLDMIHNRLLLLEYPENQLFSLEEIQIQIDRDPNGNEKVIDVLTKNDKDPITHYVNETKEICVNLVGYIKEEYMGI